MRSPNEQPRRAMTTTTRKVRWCAALRLTDVPLVGDKNASLGELYDTLGDAGRACRTALP
jgi:hypothetical protein